MAEWRILQNLVVRTLAALVGLVGLVSLPLSAEMIYRFEPSLEIALAHDGNVLNATAEDTSSDELALLRAVLPLLGESERTTWSLAYTPEAEFYRTYSDLDRLNHRAELDFSRTVSQRSSWEFGGAYLDTSDPHNELLEEDIITTRSDQQLLSASTAYSVGVSRKVDLSFRYDFRDLEYDDSEIPGHTTHAAGVSAELITGPRTAAALDYVYQYFLYPGSGDYGTQNLLVRYDVRPSEQTTLSLAGGMFLQDYRAEDTGVGDDPSGTSDTGFVGSIEWGRQGQRFALQAGLDRRVRASGGIGQSVLAHSLRLSVSGALSRNTTISLSGLLQRNEPSISTDEGNVDIVRSSVNFDYSVARHVGLRFFADYIYQQWDIETRGDLNYPRVGLSVVLSTAAVRDGASTEN
jgi:hypothetical protein